MSSITVNQIDIASAVNLIQIWDNSSWIYIFSSECGSTGIQLHIHLNSVTQYYNWKHAIYRICANHFLFILTEMKLEY